jgi:hypothetical protein
VDVEGADTVGAMRDAMVRCGFDASVPIAFTRSGANALAPKLPKLTILLLTTVNTAEVYYHGGVFTINLLC